MFAAIGAILIAAGVHDPSYGEAAFGVLVLIFAAQTLRVRVVADQSGLRIRNLVRSYRIPWDGLARLDVANAHLWLGVGSTGKVKRHRLVATTTKDDRVVLQATQSLYRLESGAGYFGEDATPRWHELLQALWPTTPTPSPRAPNQD